LSETTTPLKECATCKRVFATERDLLRATSRWRVCSLGHLWFNCPCGSTLMIKKGMFDWYNPAKHMKPDAASIFNRLAHRESLPHLPHAVMEVQSLLTRADLDVGMVAMAIRKDPIFSARLLGMANNMKLATGEKITSVDHAVMYMGRAVVSEIATVMGVNSFQAGPPEFRKSFWSDALMTGNIAARLAPDLMEGHSPDQAWVAASLCNIGKLLAFVTEPSATSEVFSLTRAAEPTSWTKAERRLGHKIDHKALGEVGASLWGLPDYVIDACTQHHLLPKMGTGRTKLTLPELVALSNQLMRWVNDELGLLEMQVLTGYLGMAKLNIRDVDFLKPQAVEWRKKIAVTLQ
jgi:HD-like signal output (HDOD) protein